VSVPAPRALPVRGLTEGAILAAVAAVLALAAHYLPVAGAVAFFLCPLPLAVLVIRQGMRVAVLAAAVAAAVGSLVGGVLIGLSIVVAFAPMGVAMGAAIRRGWSGGAVWALTWGVAVASALASVGVAMVGVGVDPRQVLLQTIEQTRRSQETAVGLYARLGLDTAQVRQAAAQVQQMMDLLPRLLPLLFVLGGATSAYLNLVVGQAVLRRLRIAAVPSLPPASAWRVPSWFLWTLPAGLALQMAALAAPVPVQVPPAVLQRLPVDDVRAVLAQSVTRYPVLETAGLNLTLFATVVFSGLGLITGWVLMDRYRLPWWYRVVVFVLAVGTPLLSVAVLVLGLADAAFDLRTRWRPAVGSGEERRAP
jgi:uncharacterized protein YybS (DUF2232 family)